MAENRCPLIENCQQKSAVCNVQLPDETCYWFRWFRALDTWHTGTPTEEGDYLCAFKMTDNSVEYGWCDWSDGAWDLLCDNDPSTGTCVLVAWQKITPYEGEELDG